MNLPGSPTLKIQQLIPRVQAALQNRTDVTESQSNPEMRPSAWIRDALREITANLPFEELRQANPPQVTIGPNLGVGSIGGQASYQYPVSYFLNGGDDVTLMEDPVIFLNSSLSGPATTTSAIPYPMEYLTPKAIVPLLGIPGGIPYYYTRFGPYFWFGTQPGQNYTVYLPYQIRHPFNDDSLLQSWVCVPPDWFDIIGYAAAERGAIALRWNEQSDYLHQKLYGDPSAKVPLPGLIQERIMQQNRDRRLSPVQISCQVARY